MFKTLFLLLFFCITCSFQGQAQTGYYQYQNKVEGTLTSLELFEDNKFQYIKQGAWTTTKTSGTWHKNTAGEIIISSEFQVNEVNATELRDETNQGITSITFTAESYKRGPRKIKSITINEHDAFGCSLDNDMVLKDMEHRNSLLTQGSKAERDSAALAYPNSYYKCNTPNVDSIASIKMSFDDHEMVYVPKNSAANIFIIKMQLAPEQSYRYFEKEPFILKRRYLISTKTGERFKRGRKP